MLTHTGEKQHACPVCGKSFAVDYGLNVHMLTHTEGNTIYVQNVARGLHKRVISSNTC